MSFTEFLSNTFSSPQLFITVLLILGVIFVNGWTDAPNAIATCVTTRCLRPRTAIITSAVFNFLGVLIMTMINQSVADTISKIVDFGDNSHYATIGLCAALFSIVVYSVGASLLGIPTSESHSLIAGLTGAALAMPGGAAGINGSEWIKVIYGMILSLALGFAVGWLVCKLVTVIFAKMERRKANTVFTGCQIFGAAAMSFMHGAQDGQKFIGVLLLGMAFGNGETSLNSGITSPIWLMFLCSVVMAVGTSVGGEKIIKSVGMDMVKLEKYQGFSADLAASICLLFSSVFGIPVSTTHTKTSAIMGVGAVRRLSAINFGVVKEMVLTWVFTFPGCGLIAFLMAKLFLVVFV
ncbi:MAG: anion permease [Ruminococcus sp.]